MLGEPNKVVHSLSTALSTGEKFHDAERVHDAERLRAQGFRMVERFHDAEQPRSAAFLLKSLPTILPGLLTSLPPPPPPPPPQKLFVAASLTKTVADDKTLGAFGHLG